MLVSSSHSALTMNFNRSFSWFISLWAARFSIAVSAFQTWHDSFLSYEKQSQNRNSEASFHRLRTQILMYLSLSRLHCRILSRRKSKIMLISSLYITFFQFSMIQFLYRKQNCKRAFIIAASSSNFIVVLHERKSFRLSIRRFVLEATSCSYLSVSIVFSRSCLSAWTLFNVKVLKTVTVWIQVYTYRLADWSMILQSSLLLFYITSILWRFESHQVVLWSHSLSSWSYDLINLALIDRFSENYVIFVIFELSYSRIANDSLNLIRLTRQVAFWH
jgi:hypothetical protein